MLYLTLATLGVLSVPFTWAAPAADLGCSSSSGGFRC